LADFVSAFPAAINAAATWDKDLIYERGAAMGKEHRGKGVNVALAPMTNMGKWFNCCVIDRRYLCWRAGRQAAAGRNWEGFGGDPFLAGVGTAETIKGLQDQGVIATVKH
jgi:beta-glucosidase